MRGIVRLLAAGSAAFTVIGGTLGLAGTASAAPSLSVTLSASGTGASAVWDTAGDPVLTIGAPSDTTYAEITINSPPTAAPSTAPTFTTNNYNAGSPHWVIQFADGDSLVGYPSNADLGGANWSVVPASSGACSSLTDSPEHDTYTHALAFIQNAGCGGNVTGAAIVADGSQAAGTSDTITDIVYDGETLVSGPDVVTVTNPGAQTGTVGTAISALDIAASSDKGDQIASYAAAGLPAGLSVDTSTGAITGTPTTAGTYDVTISATDNGGTTGTASFTWTIQALTGKADIAAKLSCPGSLTRGGTGTCTLTVSNNGPATARAVVAEVVLPASLIETTCSTGCAWHANVISWSQPYLAAGASVQDTITVKAGAGVALVLATASSASPDPDPFNNFSVATISIGGIIGQS
jgi:uncharacterized repeat protein (TIGR01451 family)